MASSNNNVPVPTFSGQGFQQWSKKMEDYLVEEGLWYVIEEGYEKAGPTELCNDEEKQELKEHVTNDLFTLSLLHKALSPKIFIEVCYEMTAKAAWDALQLMYNKMNDLQCTSEGGQSSEPMRRTKENDKFAIKRKFNEPPTTIKGGSSTQFMRNTAQIEKLNGKRKINDTQRVRNDGPSNDNGKILRSGPKNKSSDTPITLKARLSIPSMRNVAETDKYHGKRLINEPPQSSSAKYVDFSAGSDREDSLDSRDDAPASQDMPRHSRYYICFDMFLTECAVKLDYKLYFSSQLKSELPSTDLVAIVWSKKLEKEYKIPFYGTRRRVGLFGSAWRQFVEDHRLRAGHRLKFRVVEFSQTSLEIEISTFIGKERRTTLKVREKRETAHPTTTIDEDEKDDDDDSEDFGTDSDTSGDDSDDDDYEI